MGWRGTARTRRAAKREQRAETPPWTAVREHVDDGGAVADAAVAAVRDAPPEERRGAEEAQMLDDVDAFVLERAVVQRREVPDPQRDRVQQEDRRRRGEQRSRRASTGGRRIASMRVGGRTPAGIAHSSAISGAPTAISGAATTISSSCCTMCAASHASLHSSSGGDSATTSASQPARERQRLERTDAAAVAGAAPDAGRVRRRRRPARRPRLLTSIEHPLRDRARENLQREQRARGQPEHRHEPRALPRTSAVGRHVVRACAAAPPTTARRRRTTSASAADGDQRDSIPRWLRATDPLHERVADRQIERPRDGPARMPVQSGSGVSQRTSPASTSAAVPNRSPRKSAARRARRNTSRPRSPRRRRTGALRSAR